MLRAAAAVRDAAAEITFSDGAPAPGRAEGAYAGSGASGGRLMRGAGLSSAGPADATGEFAGGGTGQASLISIRGLLPNAAPPTGAAAACCAPAGASSERGLADFSAGHPPPAVTTGAAVAA